MFVGDNIVDLEQYLFSARDKQASKLQTKKARLIKQWKENMIFSNISKGIAFFHLAVATRTRETRKIRDSRGARKLFGSPRVLRVLRVSRSPCISPALFSLAKIRDYSQRARCVLLLYNWYLRIFLATYYRHGHNLELLKFTIKRLEIF